MKNKDIIVITDYNYKFIYGKNWKRHVKQDPNKREQLSKEKADAEVEWLKNRAPIGLITVLRQRDRKPEHIGGFYQLRLVEVLGRSYGEQNREHPYVLKFRRATERERLLYYTHGREGSIK